MGEKQVRLWRQKMPPCLANPLRACHSFLPKEAINRDKQVVDNRYPYFPDKCPFSLNFFQAPPQYLASFRTHFANGVSLPLFYQVVFLSASPVLFFLLVYTSPQKRPCQVFKTPCQSLIFSTYEKENNLYSNVTSRLRHLFPTPGSKWALI